MTLPPRPDFADWSAEIATAAAEYQNLTAKFYRAGVLFLTTTARAQHLRSPLDTSNSLGWATSRAVRLQIPLDATSALIEKGVIVRLTGGNDPALPKIVLTVQSAVNSSHAAVRTVECVSTVTNAPLVP